MRKNLFSIYSLILIMFFAFLFYQINDFYPFYYIWDMDHTTFLDSLLIHSKQIPSHINHPGMGMYLFLIWAQKMAYLLKAISLLKIDHLADFLNPLLGLAQGTSFLRLFSPLISISIIILLYLSLSNLWSNIKGRREFLIFLILFFCSSFWYQSHLIRTELYAVFYWSIALFLSSLSTYRRNSYKLLMIALSGFFLGLSFLTKLQSFFYILIFPFLVIFFDDNYFQMSLFNYITRYTKRMLRIELIVTFFLFVLVLALFVIASSIDIALTKHVVCSTKFKLNTFGSLYLSVTTLVLIISFLFYKGHMKSEIIKRYHSVMIFLTAGFLLSFLTHFLFFLDLKDAYTYLLYDFKILFLRRNPYSKMTQYWIHASNLFEYIKLYPATYAALFLTVIFYIKENFHNKTKITNVIIVFLLVILNGLAGVRTFLRDTLWFEILVTMVVLIVLFSLKRRTIIAPLAIVLLLTNGIMHCLVVLQKMKLNYNIYGFNKERALGGVYGNQVELYRKNIDHFLSLDTEEQRMAFMAALDYKRHLFDTQFVFYSADLSLKHIGMVLKGMPLNIKNKRNTIVEYPKKLHNHLLIDLPNVPLVEKKDLNDKLVNEHSELFFKQKKNYIKDTLLIIPRNDINIYLFSADKTITLPSRCKQIKYDGKIKSVDKTYYGLIVNSVCSIKKDELKDTFAIVSKF